MPTELTVQSMTCEGCERIVESALEEVDGVEDAEADRHDGVATVEGDADVEEMVAAVDRAGYESSA